MITVKKAGSYRKEAYMVKKNVEEYSAPKGYYLLRVCLKTRVAIGMILRGLYYQLKDPLNWILTYTIL
jgi:predicted secreted protein